jgi:uncharacterized membrane protein
MKNKQLGIFLIITSIVLGLFLGYFRYQLEESYRNEIISLEGGICEHAGESCPFEKINELLLPTLLSSAILIIMILLGLYLIFFEKSEKILRESQEKIAEKIGQVNKKELEKEKLNILLSALNDDEKKVFMAVKEQEGITQSTLKYRTDFSKAKLSSILKALEKKKLIKKVPHKKTNKIFLKKKI